MNHSRCGLETWNLRKHVANMPYALRELDVRNYSWRDVAWSKLLAACHQMASSGKCRPDWTATQATARVKAPKRLEVCSGQHYHIIPHAKGCWLLALAATMGIRHPSLWLYMSVLPLNFHSVGRHVWVRGLASVIFLGFSGRVFKYHEILEWSWCCPDYSMIVDDATGWDKRSIWMKLYIIHRYT